MQKITTKTYLSLSASELLTTLPVLRQGHLLVDCIDTLHVLRVFVYTAVRSGVCHHHLSPYLATQPKKRVLSEVSSP